ncbi:unnamed protein product [Allacma fusca]|uniref:Multifunctional fusion protein n=1 Tax=Allacma fusca TaxID=39272 RepID=A0A8J2PDE4_9HEXA|nr:unnamed protein product [Allacma fusca]
MLFSKAVRLRLTKINFKDFSTCKETWTPSGTTPIQYNLKDFTVQNEPTFSYEVGSKERRVLESTIKRCQKECEEIPIIIGGKEFKSDRAVYQSSPFNHKSKIAKFYHATPELVWQAIVAAKEARIKWEKVPFEERFKIWLKAADLISGPWRQKLNGATMLGQGKTVIQCEIDSAAELADFLRFNALYAREMLKWQPISENPSIIKNSMRLRGLEGFVAAVSPFNFTAIGGNLAYTPALMGCAVIWKPSDTAVLASWRIFQVMKEAGLPDGVVNFIPCDGPVFGDSITVCPHLACINFTGSVATFNALWKRVAEKLTLYRNYPRLVGECGGKNFHFIHPSANLENAVNCTIRSAFEYSGQKCSACSRLYVPQSLWGKFKEGLVERMKEIKIGDPTDFSVFSSAVIDEKAYDRIVGYIGHAKRNLKILHGGNHCQKEGWYIYPTLVQTTDPADKIMREEVFGPVLTAFVYPDDELENVLKLVDETTPFALTGSVFAEDEAFLEGAKETFKYSAGNYYVNDRSTGAVVGQQPFGGARHSGTNDKAGAPGYLHKFVSPQTVKQCFIPLKEWKYSYMELNK